jgi:hypothetical protein
LWDLWAKGTNEYFYKLSKISYKLTGKTTFTKLNKAIYNDVNNLNQFFFFLKQEQHFLVANANESMPCLPIVIVCIYSFHEFGLNIWVNSLFQLFIGLLLFSFHSVVLSSYIVFGESVAFLDCSLPKFVQPNTCKKSI